MTAISVAAVKALRDRTGAGMMDCKRALEEAGGDEERAIDLLRQRGAARAAKRAGRAAREGAVRISAADDGAVAAMAEVASETDFVARSEEFVSFVDAVARAARELDLPDGKVLREEEFLAHGDAGGLGDRLDELRGRVGENVRLGRVVRYVAGEEGTIGSYLHFGNRIGVLVELSGGTGEGRGSALARELAMHVAAADPLAVSPEGIPEEMLERERTVLAEQARAEGKPDHIVEKIVEGRLRKFYEQNVLLRQPFVRDPERRVEDLLREAGDLRVRRFVRFAVGE